MFRPVPLAVATTAIMAMLSPESHAEMMRTSVPYSFENKNFTGTLVYDSETAGRLPGLLMVPNWMGPTENAFKKAELIADMGYVVFVADFYGNEVRPRNQDEAGAAAKQVRDDRNYMRKLGFKALQTFRSQAAETPLDTARMGAIGFCFGGGAVLELARSGVTLDGVVSFHGNLDTPDTAAARNIRSPILVLHGAEDPMVPPEQVRDFQNEMSAASVDWQLHSYGNTVHSFTNPEADRAGQAEYNPVSARRAFSAMRSFFNESFKLPSAED